MIHFRIEDEGEVKNVSYNSSTTVRDFIIDYLTSYKKEVSLDTDLYSFQVRGKILNSPRFLNKKIKDIIRGDEVIFLRRKMVGGGPNTTDDIFNNPREYESESNSGKSYREGCKGLCIQSICKNKDCIAFNDTIYVKIGYVNDWNLMANQETEVLCPVCKKKVQPINFWFQKCFYDIKYTIKVNNKYKNGAIGGEASPDKYKNFDIKERIENFEELLFTVRDN